MDQPSASQARWSRALDDAAAAAYHAAHGATEDPPGPQGVRWRVDARTATTAVVVIALLAAVAWWGLRPADGVGLEAAGAAPSGSPSTAAPSSGPHSSPAVGPAGASAGAQADLLVHVSGAVEAPGLVSVPAGARVADAVAAAGGMTAEADQGSVNLARPVTDGEQVVVLLVGEPVPAGGTGGGLIDVNRADAAQLEELPGVGPVLAQRIVADREANGPFVALEDLERVPGVGPAILGGLDGVATVG